MPFHVICSVSSTCPALPDLGKWIATKEVRKENAMPNLLSPRTLLVATCALSVAGFLGAQVKIKKVPITETSSTSGLDMYFSYCASCHGLDGKGAGPAAPALSSPVPDLTKLAKNNGGPFPTVSVLNTLGRIQGSGAHGSEDMPIWGDLFRSSAGGESGAQMRIYNLTRYLEGIQDPPAKEKEAVASKPTHKLTKITDVRPTSGSAMYSALCSSCHGVTGLGDGPAAASLKTRPTDLTLLAKKNSSGDFPVVRIEQLLDRAPGTPAHGSQDMPVWGEAFRTAGENPSTVQLRIHNMVSYLQSIQRK
jgi:mono/diheme cytochrome c family protein